MRIRYAILLVLMMMVALLLGACGSLTGSSEIADLETQNAQLQATIQMVGTPMLTIAALEQQATQNVVFQAQMTQSAVELLAARATLTVLELGGGAAAAPQTTSISPVITNSNVPPPQLTPQPTNAGGVVGVFSPTPPVSETTQTQFSQTVMALGRDSQDCPVDVTNEFEPTEDTIYVFMRINILPAGSVLGALWKVNGEEFFNDAECWIPDRDYANICAYCSIVPDGAVFESGLWTVQLTLDGQLMAQVQFQVGAETGMESSSGAAGATPETSFKTN